MSKPTRLDRQQLDILRACCKPESDDEDHVAHARLWQLIFRHVDALEADNKRLRGMVRELADRMEQVEWEDDAPTNDDMNRWHTAALEGTDG